MALTSLDLGSVCEHVDSKNGGVDWVSVELLELDKVNLEYVRSEPEFSNGSVVFTEGETCLVVSGGH